MVSARIATCVALMAPSLAGATTVVTDTNILLSDGEVGADYTLTVYQDTAGTDPTSIFFDYDGTNVEVVAWNLDEVSDWYVVAAGDEFTRQNIVGGLFTAIFTTDGPRGPIPVGSGDFYLGVSTGQGWNGPGPPSPPNRDSFGWVELTNTVGGLANAGNAIAYDAEGILVGTTIPIPEPSTALLFATGLAVVAVTQRRRRRT
jgi:hypothetical protein